MKAVIYFKNADGAYARFRVVPLPAVGISVGDQPGWSVEVRVDMDAAGAAMMMPLTEIKERCQSYLQDVMGIEPVQNNF